jgi:hypothetical protein
MIGRERELSDKVCELDRKNPWERQCGWNWSTDREACQGGPCGNFVDLILVRLPQ